MGRHNSSDEESDIQHNNRRSRNPEDRHDRSDRRSHHRDDREDRRDQRRSHRDYDDSDVDYRRSRQYSDRNDRRRSKRHRSPSLTSIELEPVGTRRGQSLSRYEHEGNSNRRKIPTKVDRSCTDITFLVLIIVVILLWSLVAFMAIHNVNLKSLVPHGDTNGNVCGFDNARDKPYLYVADFGECVTLDGRGKIIPTFNCGSVPKFCVSRCPDKNVNFYLNIDDAICTDSAKAELNNITADAKKGKQFEYFVKTGACTSFALRSREFLGVCIPLGRFTENDKLDETTTTTVASTLAPNGITLYQTSKTIEEALEKIQPFSIVFSIFWDILDAYPVILGGFGVALLISLLWMLLMRLFADIVVWASLLSFLVVFGGLAGYTAFEAYRLHSLNPSGPNISPGNLNDINYLKSQWSIWAGVSGVLGLLFLITSIILLFLRKRIRIAIALIKQASRSVASLPTLVLFPVFPYILKATGLGLIAIFGFIIQALADVDKMDVMSACVSDFKDIDLIKNGTITRDFCTTLVAFLQHTVAVQIFNVFCGTWVVLFVSAFGYFVVAHAVAKYFWTHKDEGTQCMAVGSSVGVALRYHLGTLAFGSLILTLCGLIKKAIERLHKKANSANTWSCMTAILKCCVCCFWLFEKFLKYVNKNAYIMVAMYGKNFCRSASKAFSLVISNVLRALVITKVTDFVIFIAKLTAVAGTSAIAFFVLHKDEWRHYFNLSPLNYIAAPVVVVAVGSYILTSCFFNVYSNAVDTLFLCFLEDKKLNDGSRERPYRMPSELLRILNKRNVRGREAN